MSLKNVTVIVDDEGQFLSFEMDRWVPSDVAFFEGSYRNAIRVAENLGPKVRPAGKRIFIVQNYGFENESRIELFENGFYGPLIRPNER